MGLNTNCHEGNEKRAHVHNENRLQCKCASNNTCWMAVWLMHSLLTFAVLNTVCTLSLSLALDCETHIMQNHDPFCFTLLIKKATFSIFQSFCFSLTVAFSLVFLLWKMFGAIFPFSRAGKFPAGKVSRHNRPANGSPKTGPSVIRI